MSRAKRETDVAPLRLPDMDDSKADAPLGPLAASLLVAFTSGAILVLEILSLRLVAPYVGLTLQTSTAVIGFALAAISTGAWIGGRAADRFEPIRLLGPTVLSAGALMLLVGPVVRATGEQVRGGETSAVLVIAALAVFAPASLLSAVTPMVVKLRLGALTETGTVVGRLSGIATLGALIATFATGFLLVAAMPTSVILLALGGCLLVIGAALVFRRPGVRSLGAGVVLALFGTGSLLAASPACDVETAYHCARVVRDEVRPSGRVLQLDTLFHSYVDLEDPRHLEFSYIRAIASVLDAAVDERSPRVLHLGGGGLTLPRYLAATRPGSQSLVLEIDGGVVELDRDRLGLELGDGIEVRVQDARVGLARESSGGRDFVVGDAFGGLSVPWHLTTVEVVRDVDRVLTDDGLYALNVIDYPPLDFARAEVATIKEVFPHVALIARPEVLERSDGGNLVIVASKQPLPVDELSTELDDRAPELDLLSGPSVDSFVGDAQVLTDDYAPVDQLLTTHPGP
ncbi:MAG: fused MFS/spermidine synthase [Actinomycetota bacterium]